MELLDGETLAERLVRLKPDTTGELVRLKSDTTGELVRLKPDTTGELVWLKSDTTGENAAAGSARVPVVSGFSRTGMPLDEAMRVAIEIAGALDAAHRAASSIAI
jgi:hypothetical protein